MTSAADRPAIEWVPHGVVAAILPFNWPVSVMANKVLPALLAGNTVVVKAPPTCPGTVLLVAAAMAAVLPPGVLNVVNGPEAALGAALVGHPDVDMVSFTGGVGTGQAVMAAAAATTRPVVLELGGNDAAILAPDVRGDAALADRIVEAAFVTSGQVCMAIKRLYVHRDRLDETVDALADRLAAEVVGDGLADGVTMGPVHTASARDRVEALVVAAGAQGAAVLRPGRVRGEDEGSGGYFVSPALVVAPPADSGIVRQEQFAPALPVIPYDDVDEAVDAANDTRFGLCASVWSNDDALAAEVAARLSAGTVFVNAHGLSAIDMHAPMGGWKQSGSRRRARHRGHAGLRPPAGARAPAEPGGAGSVVVTVAIRGGTVVDGTGTSARPGRRARRGRAGASPSGRATAGGAGRHGDRRHRHARDARLRRPAHPLRRPALLGPQRQPVAAPRRHHRARAATAASRWPRMAPDHVDYMARMMARVEGMPLAALRAGLPWDWSSFGDWLGRLDGAHRRQRRVPGRALDPAPARHGRACGRRGRRPRRTPTPWRRRCTRRWRRVHSGFSTSQVHTHNDGDGQPVPSRAAGPGGAGAPGRRRAPATRGPRSS